MVNVRRAPRGLHPSDLRNSDSDSDSDISRSSESASAASEELPNPHIDIDGLGYTKNDLLNVVEILRTPTAWLDDTCIQLQLMRLKKEHQFRSVKMVFVTP